MASFGPYLRELREARGVSLDEISETTRVARAYLESLEREELSKLPAPVFIRGFMRAYCDMLGVSPDEAIARYEQSAQGAAMRAASDPGPRRAARHGRGQVMVSLVLLVVLGAALLAITTTLKSAREDAVTELVSPPVVARDPGAAAPSEMASGGSESTGASGALPASDDIGREAVAAASAERGDVPPARGDSAVVAAATARETEKATAAVRPPYRLTVRTSETTWIRVRTEDGQQLSEGVIPAGQVREWVSNRRFALRIGNASGVRLELNGRAVPPLGRRGEVIERLVLPPEDRP